MQRVVVPLPTAPYEVLVGRGLALGELLGPLLGAGKVALVSDTTVAPLHAARVHAALAPRTVIRIEVPAGEAHKTLVTAATVLDRLVEARLDRDTTVLALGGGMVGDLAGFAAATYLRGIAWIQLPTSLLAMVDAAVGGKTGVNHGAGKNLIGAFHQPRAVLADLDWLATLPEREYRAGLAEVIKYGVALDAAFLTWLESALDALLARDPGALEHAVARCCALKAAVVAADEREAGERRLLNLGHNFGHALETALGHGTWLHGEAVAAGLVMEARLAVALGTYDAADVTRLIALLARAGLPVAAPAGMTLAALRPLLEHDKKNRAGQLVFALPDRRGRAVVHPAVPEHALAAAFPPADARLAHG
jgi:3-dehydroquinate synthase